MTLALFGPRLLEGLLHGLRVLPTVALLGRLALPGVPVLGVLGLSLLGGGLLTLVCQPAADALLATGVAGLLVQAAWELGLGLLLGLTLAAPLIAFRLAGALSDVALLGAVRGGEGPLARLWGGLSLALFAALGGLRLLARTFVDCCIRYPAGSLARLPEDGALSVAALFSDALGWGLLLAAPLLLSAAVITGLLAGLGRLVVGFERLTLEFLPLRTLLVLALAVLSLAAAAPVMRDRSQLALAALRSILPL